MSKGKILIVGSNATQIEVRGGMGATGQYLNEIAVPAMTFLEAGHELVLATPNGEKPHIDPASDSAAHFGRDETAYWRAKRFYAKDPSMNTRRTLRSVIEEGLEHLEAVFFPGGQAPVVDLMQSEETGMILRHFHERRKPTVFLCHGAMASVAASPRATDFRAALIAGDKVRAKELARGWQYAGYQMTVFSATEGRVFEDHVLHARLYFSMPEALTAAGARISTTAAVFEPYVIEDREVITGQNPRSDQPIAVALIQALARRAWKAA